MKKERICTDHLICQIEMKFKLKPRVVVVVVVVVVVRKECLSAYTVVFVCLSV